MRAQTRGWRFVLCNSLLSATIQCSGPIGEAKGDRRESGTRTQKPEW